MLENARRRIKNFFSILMKNEKSHVASSHIKNWAEIEKKIFTERHTFGLVNKVCFFSHFSYRERL